LPFIKKKKAREDNATPRMCFVYCGKMWRNMGSVLGPVAGQTFEVELFQSEKAKTSSM